MRQIVYIFISSVILSCSKKNELIPFYNSSDFTPFFLNSTLEIEKKINHRISDFNFKDHNNKIISNDSIEGKIHVANFFFTSCINICPNMTNNLKLVSDAFLNHPKVKILSFTVMPWVDDQKKLNDYKNYNEIKSNNWHFLTGDKKEIYKLARNSYFAEENIGISNDLNDFLHTEYLILVDHKKRIRGIYNGSLKLDAIQLIKDIKVLLNNENWYNI